MTTDEKYDALTKGGHGFLMTWRYINYRINNVYPKSVRVTKNHISAVVPYSSLASATPADSFPSKFESNVWGKDYNLSGARAGDHSKSLLTEYGQKPIHVCNYFADKLIIDRFNGRWKIISDYPEEFLLHPAVAIDWIYDNCRFRHERMYGLLEKNKGKSLQDLRKRAANNGCFYLDELLCVEDDELIAMMHALETKPAIPKANIRRAINRRVNKMRRGRKKITEKEHDFFSMFLGAKKLSGLVFQ